MSNAFDDLLEMMVPGAGTGPSVPQDEREPGLPDMGLELRGLIGAGGMGWVYRAWDPLLAREVAVKVARPELRALARDALLREARMTASIEHRAVLPVHRIIDTPRHFAVEYRLAPVRTLEGLLSDFRNGAEAMWDTYESISAVHTIADALCHAAEQGFSHGDLHPGNLAVGPAGELVVLDWTGSAPEPGSFSGHPGYCAPERFEGAAISEANDVFALGAILYELLTLRPLRPRRSTESLADFIARYREQGSPAIDPEDVDGHVAQLCELALAPLAVRPGIVGLRDELHGLLAGRAEQLRREKEAEALFARSREALDGYRETLSRLADEDRVVTIQRAKVPSYAPIEQKRSLWESERRVEALSYERERSWLSALDSATRAAALSETPTAAENIAELWWERLRDAEQRLNELDGHVCEDRVRHFDHDGRHVRVLESPGRLSVTVDVPEARIALHRYVEHDRVLVPELVEEYSAPITRLSLEPGSYVLLVRAEGMQEISYPVRLQRHEHQQAHVRMLSPDAIGAGWRYVPAGPFQLGGDPRARQPLERCIPTLPDFFIMETCIRSSEWLEYLNAIDSEEAMRRVPGEQGLFGTFEPAWLKDGAGVWSLPPNWEPGWPIHTVNFHDVQAYAQWKSEQLGRPVRLPTEEEWEKAARGADGRAFPWGNAFDPTYACMRESRPGAPSPAPVGTYPVDRSPFGCLDMAGNMREYTSSSFDVGQVVLRGGNWGDDVDDCRVACRSGIQPQFRIGFLSARLVSDEPAPV